MKLDPTTSINGKCFNSSISSSDFKLGFRFPALNSSINYFILSVVISLMFEEYKYFFIYLPGFKIKIEGIVSTYENWDNRFWIVDLVPQVIKKIDPTKVSAAFLKTALYPAVSSSVNNMIDVFFCLNIGSIWAESKTIKAG